MKALFSQSQLDDKIFPSRSQCTMFQHIVSFDANLMWQYAGKKCESEENSQRRREKKVMLLNVVDVSHEHSIRYTNLYDIKEKMHSDGCVS